MTLYSRSGMLYLTYYHASDRIRKSTGLTDTAANRKFIRNQIIPKLQLELQYGIVEKKQIKTLRHYSEFYIAEKIHTLKPRVFQRYERILNNEILPHFGDMDIDTIKVTDLKMWANKLLMKSSPKTVSEKLSVLRAIFNYAYEDEVINRNPIGAIRLPKQPKADIEPFRADEAALLIQHAEGWYKHFLALAFYTGMRTGEMIALRWSDIDMNQRSIHVRRAISHGIESTPKTIGSKRVIPIMDVLWKHLKEQYLVTGLKGEHVFISESTGKAFFDATSLREKHWKRLLKRTGVPFRRQYNTRHTFAVAMLNSGSMKIMDISRMLGHTSTQMLLTTYAKFIKSEEIKIDRDLDPFGHNLGTPDNTNVLEVPEIGLYKWSE